VAGKTGRKEKKRIKNIYINKLKKIKISFLGLLWVQPLATS